jgi:polyisoprenoid-binding protein YceI
MNPTTTRPSPVTDSLVLPVAGTWVIDPSHTEVAFTARHLMVAHVRGRFTAVAGTVTLAEDLRNSRVDVVIGMDSVDTGHSARDAHLRSGELFDVEQFPLATFSSVRVEWHRTAGVVQGDLTIHGVTRRTPLQVTYRGRARDPWGSDRAVFSARTTVNREDFGVTWNVPLETGGVLVGKDIAIDIEMETVLHARRA